MVVSTEQMNKDQKQEMEIAEKTFSNMENESEQLEKELAQIERKGKKSHKENEELRGKIMKLDKLVYGKTKSPYKKFYMWRNN